VFGVWVAEREQENWVSGFPLRERDKRSSNTHVPMHPASD
jgi:hypothetical protein